MTIFIRILLAVLAPLAIVLTLALLGVNNVIYGHGEMAAKEATGLMAQNISAQVANRFSSMSTALSFAAGALSDMDADPGEAEELAAGMLKRLLEANSDFYRAWVALEPGAFGASGRYYKAMVRNQGAFEEVDDINPAILADAVKAPWYARTLRDGEVYTNIAGKYDGDPNLGLTFVGGMTWPVTSGGKVAGGIGLDIRYEDMLKALRPLPDARQTVLLLSSWGRIFDASHADDVGHNLLDYPFRDKERLSRGIREGSMAPEKIYSPFLQTEVLACIYPITIESAMQTIYLYMELPTQDLYTTARSAAHVAVSISLAGFLLLAGSVFYATRNIVRPIRRMIVNLNKVSRGELDVSAEAEALEPGLGNVRELDMMQTALRNMLEQIRRTHEISLRSAEAKVEKEKIIAASEAKNNFFAKVSHEIRTPMNAILGISEILLFDQRLTEGQRRHVHDIKISAESLLGIINDVLDLSRMESGRMTFSPAHFYFKEFLDNICSLGQYLAAGKNLEFTCETTGNIPQCLYMDDVRLRQILLNILSNAVKYTPKGRVALTVEAGSRNLLFSVADTGMGIKEEDQPLLFKPFQQLNHGDARHVESTGLGLAICKNITELMGGNLNFESVPGEGSVFYVNLPLTPGDAAMCRKAAEGQGAMYRLSTRVLLVDDNEINLRVASGLLKSMHGLDCDQALSGQQALEMIRDHDYHLIFMDHMMPGMDGVETTRRIREMGGKYASLPIVALTANAVQGTREMLIASGMDDFLSKPISKSELAVVLHRWLADMEIPAAACGLPGADEGADEGADASPEHGGLAGVGRHAARHPSALHAKLQGVPEVDVAAGLEALAGQEDLYEQSLNILCNKINELSDVMGKLLQEDNLRELVIHVHGFKSALASVGVTRLSGLAKELEKAAAAQDSAYCREFMPLFLEALRALGQGIRKALKENAGPQASWQEARAQIPAPPLDHSALSELDEALAAYHYDAVISALSALLRPGHDKQTVKTLEEIKTRIEVFDYEAARRILRGITTAAPCGPTSRDAP